MIAYLDASVLLRIILVQPKSLVEWEAIQSSVASALVEVECLRAIDRLRARGVLSIPEFTHLRGVVYRMTERIELVEPTGGILRRAGQPMPTAVRTLDAIHLATALAWAEARHADLVMATHDHELGAAALANGLKVIGL